MRTPKILLAATAASLVSTATFAADFAQPLPPPPPPPQYYAPPPPPPLPVPQQACCDDFGGWYLRGDIGFTSQRVASLYNVLNTSPGTGVKPVFYDFDSASSFGAGVGYKFNNWFRFDITGEYRTKANFHGLEIISQGNAIIGTDEYYGSKSEWLVLANAYADLGTWWCITPFVGVGIGVSRNTMSNFTDINTPNAGVAFGVNTSQWQFAYAGHAGLSYKVSNNFTIELAYRYLHMGDGLTGDIQTFNGTNNVNNPTTFKDLTSQDVRLGVRVAIDPTPAYAPPMLPPMLPPLIRKG